MVFNSLGVHTHRYAHDGLYESRCNQAQALAEEGEEDSEDEIQACIYYEPLNQVDAAIIATTSTTTDITSDPRGMVGSWPRHLLA